MKGGYAMKKLSVMFLLFVLVGCGDKGSILEGEWLGTNDTGGGGTITFNEDQTALVNLGIFNRSYKWEVKGDILTLKTDDEKAYLYKINEKNKDSITLEELDEDGKETDGNDLHLNKKPK